MANLKRLSLLLALPILAVLACGDRAEYVSSQGAFATTCADDASADASVEAGPDAGVADATAEASAEASVDAAGDAVAEASDDASDASIVDAVADAVAESGPADASASDSSAVDGSADSGAALAYVRQAKEITLVGDNPATDAVTLPSPVLAGSTILVFAFDQFFGGPTDPPNPVTVIDTQGGTYTHVTAQLVDVDTDASEQAWYRTGVAAGTLKTTAHYGGGSNQWHSVIVAEVANVAGMTIHTATFAYPYASNPPKAANALTSGALALGTSPGLIVGFASNSDDYGPTDPGAPAAGTGFTSFGTYTNWNGAEGTSSHPSAILESGSFPSGGTHAATFTEKTGGTENESFFVIGISFQ